MANVSELAPRPPDTFYAQYETELRGLFDVLEQPWPESLPDLVEVTQPWAKGDHGNRDTELVLTPEQQEAALGIFAKMNMVGEQPAPGNTYDQLIILGAMARGNDVRTEHLLAQVTREENPVKLADDGKIMFWGGPRGHIIRKGIDIEQPFIDESITAVRGMALENPWLARQLELPSEQRIADETAEGRLSLLRHLGNMSLSRMHLPLDTPSRNVVSDYVFQRDNQEVVVMNSQPTARGLGNPRHTTKSCTQEWLERHVPDDKPVKMLFVTSNPYAARTIRDAQTVLDEAGASHVQLTSCWAATYPDAETGLYLGEVARSLYMDNAQATT